MRRTSSVLLGLLFVLLFACPALGDGFILPERPEISLHQSYRVDFHDVVIKIENGVAEVSVEQSFTNLLDRPLEVSYLFPVPVGAVVGQFSLIVDGAEMPARLYDRDEARRIYESIVRQRRDPALLEYAGRGLFRTSVFPIPPRGTRAVKLTYHHLVEVQGDLCRLVYPLATEKYSARPLERVSVTLSLASDRPINNFYSPSHVLQILNRSARQITARHLERAVVPRNDLVIYYQLAGSDDFNATCLTYRPTGSEDGYFLLLAAPRADLPRGAILPKTILFVLDRSGSMSGEKLRQAKEALRQILPNLDPRDRFNILVYSDNVDAFQSKPVQADPKQIEAAQAFVAGVTAMGGTDIESALSRALAQFEREEDRSRYVVFLTDGQPTVGVTDPIRIRENVVKANNTAKTRLFVFGVGYDVNTVLLDGLAGENRGLTSYVRPGEDLEVAVGQFYRQIQYPVLTDLALKCTGGVTLLDYYPRQLPDLYHGGQLVVTGRYRGSGAASVILEGKMGGKARSFSYRTEFPAAAGGLDRAFVARLWASRKIGYLLDQVRLLGSHAPGYKELVDEIVRLAKVYGIATEYTSFLVLENDRAVEKLESFAAAPASGASAVGGASASKSLQQSDRPAETGDYAAGRVRVVGDKTFYLKDGLWVDAAFQQDMQPVKIAAFSDEYFALASALGDRSIYLSFAERIILVWNGNAYQIEPPKQ